MANVRHRIERTRNKYSRAVYRGNTIVIRLARNLSKTEERDHIQSLLRRMTHLVLEERSKTLIAPFRTLLDGAQQLTLRLPGGKRLCLQLRPERRTVARRVRPGVWSISVSPQLRRVALHKLLWKVVAAEMRPQIERLVHEVNAATLRVRVSKVTLAFASTQWGSCSPRGVIMLNAALLFVPVPLLKYVIVHELAHRRIPNHSDAYWNLVESVMPRYRKAYEALQNHRLPTL